MPEQTDKTLAESNMKRDEDFVSLYANHVFFEPSVWDLKVVFGQLSQDEGRAIIEQHTAITIPWPTAKLMSYFLNTQLLIHEGDNGRIQLPDGVLPPELEFPEDLESDPKAQAALETLRKMREAFITASKRS